MASVFAPRILAGCCLWSAVVSTAPAAPENEPQREKPPQFTLDIAAQLRPSSLALERQRENLAQIIPGKSALPARPSIDELHGFVFKTCDLFAGTAPVNATRWLLGLDEAADRQVISELTKGIKQNVVQARKALATRPEGSKEQLREIETALNTLEAFVDLFLAMSTQGPIEQRQEACRGAAMSMAELREHSDEAVAASATLWQAMAWELAGRRDRALSSLPEALQDPQHLPYDFFSRLLRRILADAGEHPAAIALTIRIRQECDDWFKKDRRTEAAERVAALLQCRITRAWIAGLKPSNAEVSNSLTSTLAQIQKDLFPEGADHEVYQLDKMVPVFITAPKITLPRPRSTTTPGTQPARQSPPQKQSPTTTATTPA